MKFDEKNQPFKKGDKLTAADLNRIAKYVKKHNKLFVAPPLEITNEAAGLQLRLNESPERYFAQLTDTGGNLGQNDLHGVYLWEWDNSGSEWSLGTRELYVWSSPLFDTTGLPQGTNVEITWFRTYHKWVVTNAECDE